MFDIQVKRIHEYKRQLLNALHIIHLYNEIKDNPKGNHTPRTFIFAGKSAPGYFIAKLIIKLINSIAYRVNNDPAVGDLLKVVFMKNYCVSLAEVIYLLRICPNRFLRRAMRLRAGYMKFMLKGSLTMGTLDGANIEIKEESKMKIFSSSELTADEVLRKRQAGYNPYDYYMKISYKAHSGHDSGDYSALLNPESSPDCENLLDKGDFYLHLRFESYKNKQKELGMFLDKRHESMSLMIVARSVSFSSDRTIKEYAREF
jgi:starch phosphorylase